MMQFNDLLRDEEIDPKDVIVFRHRPKQRKLREVLSWLVEENHDVFNAYQQTQGPIVEKAMFRAKFVASFIGHEPGKAIFVALYKKKGQKPISSRQLRKTPAVKELATKYDPGYEESLQKDFTTTWFDLVMLPFRSDWKGKLIVTWPGKELSWWRWANKNSFQIHAITEDSAFISRMPKWNQLTLSWNQLEVLPKKWKEELSRWRGIYFILDESDGTGYVGAAYGEDNLYGRWRSYVKSGHGGNKEMKGRNPKCFQFSILQILPHDMERSEVLFIEDTWKDRLHTREYGLNGN